MFDRIYGKAPFVPEPGAPMDCGWDYEVRNSRGRVLWYGTSEYDLDRWRTEHPMRKSWTVRVRFFNDGWCIGCYQKSGADYEAGRNAELAARDHMTSPRGQAETRRMMAGIAARVFAR